MKIISNKIYEQARAEELCLELGLVGKVDGDIHSRANSISLVQGDVRKELNSNYKL